MEGSINIKKYGKITYLMVFLLLSFILISNLWVLAKRLMDGNAIAREIKEINNEIPLESECRSANANPDELNADYSNYLKISHDDVDIKNLKNINSDTVGFLSVSGTNINYPVVQAKDNKFYLRRSFKKSENSSGWIFMDYRNDSESFGKNTIIYGHSNLDKTMFGSLSNVLDEDWYRNKENGKIKFVNLSGTTNWKIISVYTIPAESYYMKTDFKSADSYGNWLHEITKRSLYNFGYEAVAADKIMTFSTCYKDIGDIRLVVHAKKI